MYNDKIDELKRAVTILLENNIVTEFEVSSFACEPFRKAFKEIIIRNYININLEFQAFRCEDHGYMHVVYDLNTINPDEAKKYLYSKIKPI